MKTLDELAIFYETDKSSIGHNYVKYYEQFFSSLREASINLLEIGIYKGGSLRMWKDYFQNSNIHGIDIVDCKHYECDKIHTHILNQSNRNELDFFGDRFRNYFDIMIDDGSHMSADMILSFEMLFPYLKSGGFYVIEDLLCNYSPQINPPHTLSIMNRLKQLSDDVQLNGKILLNANKIQTSPKYYQTFNFTYFEQYIEYIFISCGLAVIKKI